MEKNTENERGAEVIEWLYRDPRCTNNTYMGTLKSVKITYIGLFGYLGMITKTPKP